MGTTEEGVTAWGEEAFKPGRFDGFGARFRRFGTWVNSRIKYDVEPDLVAFEAIGFVKFTQAAEVLHGLTAMLTAQCEETATPYEGVGPGTIKKHATGSGSAKKPAMKVALLERWGEVAPALPRPIKADLGGNDVDAIWLCDLILKRNSPPEVVT